MYSMPDHQTVTKTLKVRVRDKHAKTLRRQSAAINFVWNYINDLSFRAIRDRGHFLSAYDIHPYTKGAGKELGLHSQSLQVVAQEYVTRRKQFRKQRLAWRKTHGVRRSLGWVPVNTGAAQWKNGQVFFNGQHFKVWDSYGLSQHRFRSACFVEDGPRPLVLLCGGHRQAGTTLRYWIGGCRSGSEDHGHTKFRRAAGSRSLLPGPATEAGDCPAGPE